MEALFHVALTGPLSSGHDGLSRVTRPGLLTLPATHSTGRIKVVRSDRPPERGRVADAGAHRRGSNFVGTQRRIGEGPCDWSELLVAPGHEIFGVLDGAAEVEQGHVPEISGA